MVNYTEEFMLTLFSVVNATTTTATTTSIASEGGAGKAGGSGHQGRPLCVPGEEFVPQPVPPDLLKFQKSWLPTRDITTIQIAVKTTFYVLVMVVDLVGNGLVLVLVSGQRRMRTPTNVLLVNLAAADLLLCLVCMWVHLGSSLQQDWPFGLTICKINLFTQVAAITSSVLTLTVISVERFFAIVFPLRRMWTLRLTMVMIAVIWVIACSIASPQLHVRQLEEFEFSDRHVISCTEQWRQFCLNEQSDTWTPHKTVYHMVVAVVLFLMPIVVMVVSYTVIGASLLNRKAPGSSSSSGHAKKKVVRMLVMVVVVFVICWSPIHLLEIIPLFHPEKQASEEAVYAALFIGYANSALNPVMYAGFNDNFRRGFQDMFHCGRHAKGIRVEPYDGHPSCSRAPRNVVRTPAVTAAATSRHQGNPQGPAATQDKHLLHVQPIFTSQATTSFSGTKQNTCRVP